MSTLSDRIDAASNADLLIKQWRDAPRARALVDALLSVIHDHLVQPLADLERMSRIDEATGFWLDCIGLRLGLSRPATDLGNFAFFGFDGSGGLGFDQGPLATVVEALSARVPVGDDFYRVMLRMRASDLLNDSSVSNMETVIQRDFPEATYQDYANMTATLRITDSRTQLLDLLTTIEAWPKPSGVELTVVTT